MIPRWFQIARRLWPHRCREVPVPGRGDVLLRQLAIVSRRVYLQSFAAGEEPGWLHIHEGPTLVIGLRGSLWERTLIGEQVHRAPFVRFMSRHLAHRVDHPRGHLSLFIILRRERERQYVRESVIPWQEYVTEEVERV